MSNNIESFVNEVNNEKTIISIDDQLGQYKDGITNC